MASLVPREEPVSKTLRRDIELLSRLERDLNRERTAAERVADAIADFSGSIRFALVHLGFFAAWIILNLGVVPLIRPWDRYPFLLLNMSVSLEAIFLATFVLIKQNRMSRRADQRAKLDLQINLLAEREMTLVLQMLQRISTRLGVVCAGEELEELSEETPIEALASELQEQPPPE